MVDFWEGDRKGQSINSPPPRVKMLSAKPLRMNSVVILSAFAEFHLVPQDLGFVQRHANDFYFFLFY